MNKKMFGMALAAVMAAALTACGGSSAATTAADTTAADTQAATTEAGSAAEKAELKTVSEGKLVMSTNAEFPPYEYHDADDQPEQHRKESDLQCHPEAIRQISPAIVLDKVQDNPLSKFLPHTALLPDLYFTLFKPYCFCLFSQP